MKIASIDIGTNAIKSKIFKTTPASIEFVQGIRSPIRLGSDVFNQGNLSESKLDQVIKTIREYEEIFTQNLITQYEIVATSAFRDTENSEDARRYIETAINRPLRVISGLEEAKLIRFHPKSNTGKNKIFVDLGGGSTEFFIRNNEDTVIRSFQLGAVRNLLGKDEKQEWNRLEEWLQSIKPKKKLIGIGGNIRSFLNAHKAKDMSMNEFRKKVMDRIQDQLNGEAEEQLSEKIIDFFIDKTKLDAPDSMIENTLISSIDEARKRNPNNFDEEK